MDVERGVRVALSSGDVFYVRAGLADVARAFDQATVRFSGGRRVVFSDHVTQLTVENVPSVEVPETLDAKEQSR